MRNGFLNNSTSLLIFFLCKVQYQVCLSATLCFFAFSFRQYFPSPPLIFPTGYPITNMSQNELTYIQKETIMSAVLVFERVEMVRLDG